MPEELRSAEWGLWLGFKGEARYGHEEEQGKAWSQWKKWHEASPEREERTALGGEEWLVVSFNWRNGGAERERLGERRQ